MGPLVVPAIAGLASLLGGIFGNRSQTQSASTSPTMDPAYSPLQAMLLQQIMARIANPSKLPSGYEAGQIQGINQTYNQVGQSLDNRLTARGLGTSPVAGVGAATLEQGRAGDIVRMQQGLPLLERQMQDQDLASALQALSLGRGSTSTQTSPSNMAAGGMQSLSSMLAYLYGKGALGGSTAAATTSGVSAIGANGIPLGGTVLAPEVAPLAGVGANGIPLGGTTLPAETLAQSSGGVNLPLAGGSTPSGNNSLLSIIRDQLRMMQNGGGGYGQYIASNPFGGATGSSVTIPGFNPTYWRTGYSR